MNSSATQMPDAEATQMLEDLALGEDYALTSEYVEMVVDAADRGDGMRLRELVAALHPADVADLLGFLSAEHRDEVVPWLPPDVLAETLPELDDGVREDVLESIAPRTLAEALQELDPRSRRIVEERWLKVNDDSSGGMTLHELAAEYGVSRR